MQTVERPRFRQDLVAEPIEDGGGRFIDVADPDSGNLFRFYEVEYSLACAMDGERDVAGIVKWAQEELGLTPSANEVRTVIATLGNLGYLDGGAAAAASTPEPDEATHEAATVLEPAARASVEAHRPPIAESRPTTPARAKTPASGTPRKPEAELGRGVVAPRGGGASASAAADLELGAAGTRTSGGRDEAPSAGDFELGAPGANAPSAKQPGGRGGDAFALGASGASAAPTSSRGGAAANKSNPALSTDLAADMAISPADVKEAVRASQVMKSVDVPPELAAELESPKPSTPHAPASEAIRAAATEAPVARPVQPVVQAPVETKKPIEMPTERPVMPKAPPAKGPSPILLVALVLVLLGAGAFAVYKLVLKKDQAAPVKKVEALPPKPMPPAPPPVETAKLAVEQPAPEEIKPSGAATIATIVASDTAVKAGEPIARLVGFKPLETEVATAQKAVDKAKADIDKATSDRDAAQTAGNKNGVTQAEARLAAAQKTLTSNETALATKTAALDKLLIKAPAAGKVTAVAKANSKVTPTDIIATLSRDPVVVATFKSAGDVASDTRVLLAIKGSEQKLSCTVVATGGDGTKIACPKDAAPDGTEVIYAGVDPAAPAPDETKPAEGSDAGSAAGSADSTTEHVDQNGQPLERMTKPANESPTAPKPAPKKAPAPTPAPKKAPADKPAAPAPADKPAEPAPAAGSAS